MRAFLDDALEWAGKSVPIFPCHPHGTTDPETGKDLSKTPACPHGFLDATCDEAQIRKWWAINPTYNMATPTGTHGLAVIDTDPPDGEANWLALELDHGPSPETYTVRTPRGGRHRYYRGELPSTTSRLALHVDTRGVGGYVLVPPSRTAAGQYVLETPPGVKAQPLPGWIGEALKRTAPVAAAPFTGDLDLKVNVDRFVDWLGRHPPAVEGEGGDTHTVATAAVGRDLGVSEDKALDLMLEHWNARCSPPWEPDELAVKVAHGFQYAQNEAGCDALAGPASETFGAASGALGLVRKSAGPVPFRDVLARTVAPVAELIPGLLEKRVVTFLSGPGGVHKSRLALQWGLCLDVGAPIFGRAVDRTTFVYLSCEDHADEVARRAQAITHRLHLAEDGGGQFYDLTGEDATLAVVHDSGSCEPLPAFEALHSWLRSIAGHKFVVVDSTYNVLRFEGSAKINEGGVKAAIGLLQRLCDEADATLLVLWHPSQAGQDRGDASGWSVAWHNAPRARLSIGSVKDRDDTFELKVEKRNHGAKGKPITLHWADGALLPRSEVAIADSGARFLDACVEVATLAAEQDAPIQRQRKLDGWMLDEIEKAAGFRPTDREAKDALARAVGLGRLRYMRGTNRWTAGFYPMDLERAAELARGAKHSRKSIGLTEGQGDA